MVTISFLFLGVVFGLSAGLTPGPLLMLVVTETLKHGIKEGIKISIAPLITDLPIVLVTLFIFSRLSDMQPVLGAISLFGGAFLVYLGYESISFKGVDVNAEYVKPQSVRKGVVANILNPNPYIFWFAIGAPTVVKAFSVSLVSAISFVSAFYLLLVGSKVAVTLIIGKSRIFLKSNSYIYLIRFLGIVLLIFALFFFREGLKTIGVI